MVYAGIIILSFTGMLFGMQGVKLKPAPQPKQEYTSADAANPAIEIEKAGSISSGTSPDESTSKPTSDRSQERSSGTSKDRRARVLTSSDKKQLEDLRLSEPGLGNEGSKVLTSESFQGAAASVTNRYDSPTRSVLSPVLLASATVPKLRAHQRLLEAEKYHIKREVESEPVIGRVDSYVLSLGERTSRSGENKSAAICCYLSRRGNRVATIKDGQIITIFNVRNPDAPKSSLLTRPSSGSRLSKKPLIVSAVFEANMLITGSDDGAIEAWQIGEDLELKGYKQLDKAKDILSIRLMRLNNEGTYYAVVVASSSGMSYYYFSIAKITAFGKRRLHSIKDIYLTGNGIEEFILTVLNDGRIIHWKLFEKHEEEKDKYSILPLLIPQQNLETYGLVLDVMTGSVHEFKETDSKSPKKSVREEALGQRVLVASSPSFDHVLAALDDKLRRWGMHQCEEVLQIGEGRITDIAANDKMALVGTGNILRAYLFDRRNRYTISEFEDEVRQILLTQDGKRAAVLTAKPVLYLCELSDLEKPLIQEVPLSVQGQITSLQMNREGTRILTSNQHGGVTLYVLVPKSVS